MEFLFIGDLIFVNDVLEMGFLNYVMDDVMGKVMEIVEKIVGNGFLVVKVIW